MLTPEERQRIEEEERKRQEEEQYRAEVRANLRQPEPGEGATPVKQSNWLVWLLGITSAVAIVTLIVIYSSSPPSKSGNEGAPVGKSAAGPVPKTRYVPVTRKVATGQILVKANGHVQYRITITPDMVEPTVTGSFNASGGSGNDITAVLADETNFINWINGHQARVFWGTEGRQTTGNFGVRLRPGTYYLAFSNKFSAFTDKQVFLEVDLNYKRAEAYY